MIRPSSFSQKLTPDCIVATLVALAPLVYFFPAVSGSLIISPDDGLIFNIPLRVAAANIIRAGYLPLWNPYLFCGMPLHGAAQAGLLFPVNWLYLCFSPQLATNLMMLSSYSLAALGSYLYARRVGTSITGSAVTSLVWQWGGFLVNQIGHTNILQTAAMLPWVLWAIDGYGLTGRRVRAVLLAALVALQAFAGHQQTLSYSLLLAAAYAIWLALSSKESVRACYLRSLAFVGAGMLLAATQILPTFELLHNSLRETATYDFFTSFSMPAKFITTLFAPYLMGGGNNGLFRAPYTGPNFYAEYVPYVGLLAMMLALAALLLKPDARTKFWGVAAVACLLLALGRFAPLGLYKLIYYVPVLNLFRVPARHLMEAEFALAVLAGRGVSAVAAARGDRQVLRRVAVSAAVTGLLTCLVVTWGRPAAFQLGRRAPVSFLRAPELFVPVLFAALSAWALWVFARGRRRYAPLLPCAVLALDLAVWGQATDWRTHSPSAQSELWREPAVVKYLREREAQEHLPPYRVLTAQHSFDPDSPVPAPSQDFVLSLQPDIYMMHGIENAAGYDGFGLSRYSRLAGDMKVWGELADPEQTLRGDGRAIDLLNVHYLLATAHTVSASSSPRAFPQATLVYGGQSFAEEGLSVPNLDAGSRLSFSVPPVEASRVALESNLASSSEVPDAAAVAHLRLHAQDGRSYDFDIRAGEHTSEWAFDRPDVSSQIQHRRAPVAESYEVKDSQVSYDGHTYVASFALPQRAVITGGEISVTPVSQSPQFTLGVQRLTLLDEADGKVYPLRREWVKKETLPATGQTAPETPRQSPAVQRWRPLGQVGDVEVFENLRALPRAWLTGGEMTMSEQEELQVIRTGKLPDGQTWEPLQTALVESPTGINAGSDAAPHSADVTQHEPNRIEVRTTSAAPALLVLSENHYPGWLASVDGRATEIVRVNYNLRGVAVPSGEHTVEFVYRPRSVIVGVIISLLTLAGLALWWASSLLRDKRRALNHGEAPTEFSPERS